mmetsp:Transcript_4393/g.12283  ORF Transcript_4393/g.12283 Transcript_4393/m.12283 type:complete len:220 (-) Transcript_4393:219-878(-)
MLSKSAFMASKASFSSEFSDRRLLCFSSAIIVSRCFLSLNSTSYAIFSSKKACLNFPPCSSSLTSACPSNALLSLFSCRSNWFFIVAVVFSTFFSYSTSKSARICTVWSSNSSSILNRASSFSSNCREYSTLTASNSSFVCLSSSRSLAFSFLSPPASIPPPPCIPPAAKPAIADAAAMPAMIPPSFRAVDLARCAAAPAICGIPPHAAGDRKMFPLTP